MFKADTAGLTVQVMPVYIDERSDPANSRFFWAYRVTIENNTSRTVQLIGRYWHITDCHGHVEEIRGEGVVGEQPVIEPGAAYSYTSGCPLNAPSGIMLGSYSMRHPDGETFEIEIPAFSLDLPDITPSLN